jgi:isopenicillin N synthase-like dioxygenase
VLALPRGPDRPGAGRAGGRGPEPRAGQRVFRHRVHRGPDHLVPHLPLPARAAGASGWGVGEHTDYGLLTLLTRDDSGGLQVAAPEGWIDAPPIPGTLVANIGDMLDRLTGGWYRSTPHRVRNLSGHGRLSFPFFLDPGFAAEVPPLAGRAAAGDDGRRRWDGQDLRAFTGTYGDYLLGKVARVLPQLRSDVLE